MKSSLASSRSVCASIATANCGMAWPERKIAPYSSDPVNWILEAFMDPSIRVAHRDTAPVRYWVVMGLEIFALVGCFFVAIFGWWHPTT